MKLLLLFFHSEICTLLKWVMLKSKNAFLNKFRMRRRVFSEIHSAYVFSEAKRAAFRKHGLLHDFLRIIKVTIKVFSIFYFFKQASLLPWNLVAYLSFYPFTWQCINVSRAFAAIQLCLHGFISQRLDTGTWCTHFIFELPVRRLLNYVLRPRRCLILFFYLECPL